MASSDRLQGFPGPISVSLTNPQVLSAERGYGDQGDNRRRKRQAPKPARGQAMSPPRNGAAASASRQRGNGMSALDGNQNAVVAIVNSGARAGRRPVSGEYTVNVHRPGRIRTYSASTSNENLASVSGPRGSTENLSNTRVRTDSTSANNGSPTGANVTHSGRLNSTGSSNHSGMDSNSRERINSSGIDNSDLSSARRQSPNENSSNQAVRPNPSPSVTDVTPTVVNSSHRLTSESNTSTSGNPVLQNDVESSPQVSVTQNRESGAATVTIREAVVPIVNPEPTPTTNTTNANQSQNLAGTQPTTLPPMSQSTVQRQANTPSERPASQRWSASSDLRVSIDDQRRLICSNASLDIIGEPTGNVPRPPVTIIEPSQTATNDSHHSRPVSTGDILPDILNSHVPPPYEQRRHRRDPRSQRPTSPRRSHRHERPRRSRQSRGRRPQRRRTSSRSSQTNLDEGKQCCSQDCCRGCLETVTRFRWVLVFLALLGVCCVVTGIILGALHVTGSSFLMLSLMFIGLGIMLVIVVVVGWRCTPSDHEPCHLLFGLGAFYREPSPDPERAYPERPRERTPHWFGGVLYPEFRYRRPPPSYNASMQDYQQQIMIAAQMQTANQPPPGDSLPNSPPPTYRSQASVRPGIHITFPTSDEYPSSRPPTYRSHVGTLRSDPHARPALVLDNSQSTVAVGTDNHTNNATSNNTNSSDAMTTTSVQTTDTDSGVVTTSSTVNEISTDTVIINVPETSSPNPTTSTPSSASEDHVVRLTLSDESTDQATTNQVTSNSCNGDDNATTEEASSSDRGDNNIEVIGENTMHRGFRLVESLESMLDDTLRSMDEDGLGLGPTETSDQVNTEMHMTSM